ncbi:phage portal protein [Endozoicomonas euniceicola]|uniref:Phage portal protein n=1 Tax=Endozoicomonas euniceicola TaxID=1234143 RepID=A0ABY6GTX3_9GAMM|nr:phage portal protein [Endozoicomonas euniceicola]UYM16199.1 phage portal protein [Endozoicomonas euniceicola]
MKFIRQLKRLLPFKNAAYTAAGNGRRAKNWYAPNLSPNDTLKADLGKLQARSRAAIRNDPWAASGITKLVSNVIGKGITPKSLIEDDRLRIQVQDLFVEWSAESDADGLLSFTGQQSLITRSMFEAGECFVRLRPRRLEDGLSVPLQLQVLESEFVPIHYNQTLPSGNVIKGGIEFNRLGQRVAYWMHREHPAEFSFDSSKLARIPADDVLHVFEALRPGQLRGQPLLTQVLVRLFHLDNFDDATLLRQEIANLFTGFITKPSPEQDNIDPLTGKAIEYDQNDLPMVGMEPGTMQELAPGEEVSFNTPPGTSADYPNFMRQQLMAVATGIGLPFELLTGDMKGVSDRALRLIINEFRRRIQQIQHNQIVFQLCRPVWQRWMDLAVVSGALTVPDYASHARQYQRVKWIAHGWAYMHPVQDMQAQKIAVRSGFKSRSEVVSEMGYDSEQIDAEISADNRRADELELHYDSDSRDLQQEQTSLQDDDRNGTQ